MSEFFWEIEMLNSFMYWRFDKKIITITWIIPSNDKASPLLFRCERRPIFVSAIIAWEVKRFLTTSAYNSSRFIFTYLLDTFKWLVRVHRGSSKNLSDWPQSQHFVFKDLLFILFWIYCERKTTLQTMTIGNAISFRCIW